MRAAFLMLMLAGASLCTTVEVLFLDLALGNAPSIEKTFAWRIREYLGNIDTIRLIDQERTREFCKAASFTPQQPVTVRVIEKIREYFGDSIMILWASVRECSFTPVRSWGVACRVQGEMTVACGMYSLLEKSHIYSGQIRCVDSRHHGLIFFSPVRLEHVTAVEQGRLAESLSSLAARRTVRLVQVVLRSLLARREFSPEEQSERDKSTASEIIKIPYTEGDLRAVAAPSSEQPVSDSVAPADSPTDSVAP